MFDISADADLKSMSSEQKAVYNDEIIFKNRYGKALERYVSAMSKLRAR